MTLSEAAKRLVYDRSVSSESPCIKGTTCTVQNIISMIVDGKTWADIKFAYDIYDINDDAIRAAILWVADTGEKPRLDVINDPAEPIPVMAEKMKLDTMPADPVPIARTFPYTAFLTEPKYGISTGAAVRVLASKPGKGFVNFKLAHKMHVEPFWVMGKYLTDNPDETLPPLMEPMTESKKVAILERAMREITGLVIINANRSCSNKVLDIVGKAFKAASIK